MGQWHWIPAQPERVRFYSLGSKGEPRRKTEGQVSEWMEWGGNENPHRMEKPEPTPKDAGEREDGTDHRCTGSIEGAKPGIRVYAFQSNTSADHKREVFVR